MQQKNKSERSDDRDVLEDLGERLRKARADTADPTGRGDPSGGALDAHGLSVGLRIGVELVAGVGVGVIIGLALDRWLGTAPWLLIAFLIIGICAGFLTVFRTIGELERRKAAEASQEHKE